MQLAITNNINLEKSLLIFSTGLALSLVAAYMYFVSASIVHVVIRKEINHEMTQLHTEIALLESDYMQAQHLLSSDVANLAGFVATGEKIFLDPTPASLVVRTQ